MDHCTTDLVSVPPRLADIWWTLLTLRRSRPPRMSCTTCSTNPSCKAFQWVLHIISQLLITTTYLPTRNNNMSNQIQELTPCPMLRGARNVLYLVPPVGDLKTLRVDAQTGRQADRGHCNRLPNPLRSVHLFCYCLVVGRWWLDQDHLFWPRSFSSFISWKDVRCFKHTGQFCCSVS